jgi:hypothetical protein
MFVERVPGIRGSVLRGLEAATTTHFSPEKSTSELLSELTDRKSFKQERLMAAIKLTGKILPNFDKYIAKLLINTDRFPIDSSFNMPYFKGFENKIFIFESTNNDSQPTLKVLKVNKASIGMNDEQLALKANEIKSEYNEIKSWYSHLPGFVPEEQMIILHSHLFALPAVATINNFIPGEKKGIFEDYTAEELVNKLNTNPHLKEQFLAFGQTLIDVYYKTGKCIDLPGHHNVSIVSYNGGDNLVLYDPHIIYTKDKLADLGNESVEEIFRQRFSTVEKIINELTPEQVTASITSDK